MGVRSGLGICKTCNDQFWQTFEYVYVQNFCITCGIANGKHKPPLCTGLDEFFCQTCGLKQKEEDVGWYKNCNCQPRSRYANYDVCPICYGIDNNDLD